MCTEEDVDCARRSHRTALLFGVAILLSSSGAALSLDNAALGQIASAWDGKVCRLKVDLHEPDPGGDSMQAPTLEKRGWHHNNPTGPIVLKAGTSVTVIGLFNYSERGLFLELAREQEGLDGEPAASRPRCRIRIMVETPGSDSAGQAQEAGAMISRVLEATANP
ncbi:MAG TPA: hypothetical protein VFE84_13465 [Patescibacteria group bacterium]|nr:hypothetical protein [Patescibacteria group bacterium]